MKDLIAAAIIVGIILLVVVYIIKEKKKGTVCIGCPHAQSCGKHKAGPSACSCHSEEH